MMRAPRLLAVWIGLVLVAGTPLAQAGLFDYRVGPEDVLRISVWRDDALTREVLVRPDGLLSFPLIGDVKADGRTVEEIQTEVAQRLSRYVPDPTVSVEVVKITSYRIYVVGKVNRPGEYLVGHDLDVMQALSLAGGLTPFASENQITILRRVTGETFDFRYGAVKRGKELGQNIVLQRGDVVVVP
jgi:polysaccharide export outer membrane protein